MQTITILESKLEEARVACEKMKRGLHKKLLASFFLPEYVVCFERMLEELLELIDDTLGLIATSERSLQRTEMLSRVLMKEGLSAQPISLIQTRSHQGEIAHELAAIWQTDEEKMIDIEANLQGINHLLRDLQSVREQASTKIFMDWLGFPNAESLPETISPQLMKDLLDPDIQSPVSKTITQMPSKRVATPAPAGQAWPVSRRRSGR